MKSSRWTRRNGRIVYIRSKYMCPKIVKDDLPKFWLSYATVILQNFVLGLFYFLQNEKQPPDLICEKSVLKTFGKLTGKHPCQILFLIKLQDEVLVQVVFCKFFEDFKNTFSTERLQATASAKPIFWSFYCNNRIVERIHNRKLQSFCFLELAFYCEGKWSRFRASHTCFLLDLGVKKVKKKWGVDKAFQG